MSELNSLLEGSQVLVVDDHTDDCLLMTFLLKEYGMQVETVFSAQEALDSLTKRPVDLLISDIAMPSEDGCSLIRQIRALHPQQGGRIPAIAITALVTETARQQALMAGFQAFLTKPVQYNELATVLVGLTCSIMSLDASAIL